MTCSCGGTCVARKENRWECLSCGHEVVVVTDAPPLPRIEGGGLDDPRGIYCSGHW